METKSIKVICLPSKEILIVVSVRESYLEHYGLIALLAITKKSFSIGDNKNITNRVIFTLQ